MIDNKENKTKYDELNLDGWSLVKTDELNEFIDNNKRNQTLEINHSNKIIENIILDPNHWILKKVNYKGIENQNIPNEFLIEKLFPNPFNNIVNININIPKKGNLEVVVFDLLGKKVKEIYNQETNIGKYNFSWDGKNDMNGKVNSGLYLFKVVFNENTKTIKSVYLK